MNLKIPTTLLLSGLGTLALLSCTSSQATSTPLPTDLKTELRAPAYPLVTVDPYFNAWSMTNELYADQPRHWTEKPFPLIGAIRVDGQTYRFMGKGELPLKTVLRTAVDEAWEGRYTTQAPKGDWTALDYDDSSWQVGQAAWGTPNEPNLRTLWETEDIWVRRTFDLAEDLSGENVYLNYFHDDIFELYVNGVKVVDTGYTWRYNVQEPLPQEAVATLKPGKNIITAHCHNRTGGGHVDFGLAYLMKGVSGFETPAKQLSASVLPTQTIYTFECGPVELDLIFTSPLLMDDLDLLSRPVSYITYQVASSDGAEHDVQIYFEATPQWAVHDLGQRVSFERLAKNGLSYLKTGTVEQPMLQKSGDDVRIDWGYFYVGAKDSDRSSLQFGKYFPAKQTFSDSGTITPVDTSELSSNMKEEMTVLAYTNDLGAIGSKKVSDFIMLGYDDLYSAQIFGENKKGYWTHGGEVTITDAFEQATKDYSSIMKRCDDFNRELMDEATKSGGQKYCELVSLVYRHAIAAHKLMEGPDGELLFPSKENNSNGSIGTVDLSYPSSPLFLLYNTDLCKGLINHIFYYSESGKWTKPFAAHDIGTYPIGNGQTYGGDMPIEETGNMLIMTAAIAAVEGNADYAKKHWEVLTVWADYLLENGMDPENQLNTDDFAGHSAHNANLSIKAIMGIASYSKLAGMLGEQEVADKYMNRAKEMAQKWQEMAFDGDHYRLCFDQPGTWSQKYNIVWDKLLGFNIFDPAILRTEMDFYLTKQNYFGLPLDSRATYTKSDWIMWTATMTDSEEDFHALVDHLYTYANETTSRVPISDWHDTISGERMNFKARSVVGGYYMKILRDRLLKY